MGIVWPQQYQDELWKSAKSMWYWHGNIHSSFNKGSFKREDKSYGCYGNSEVRVFGLRNQHSKNFVIKKWRQRILTCRYFWGRSLGKSLSIIRLDGDFMKWSLELRWECEVPYRVTLILWVETNDLILPLSSPTQNIGSFLSFNLGHGFYRGGQGGGHRGRN